MHLQHILSSKRAFSIVSVVLLICFLLQSVADAQIYSSYSVVTFLQGEVLVMTKNASKWSPSFKGQRLMIGDKIKTGRSGRAEVKFANSAVFRMRPLSQLEIPDHKDNKGKRVGYLDMKFGKVWSKVKPVGKGQQFRVKTPTAVAGIRGTVFTLSVNAITKKSIVAVLEGGIDFNAGGKNVPVGKNQKSVAEQGKEPSAATDMSEDEINNENKGNDDNAYGNTTDTTPPNINLTSPASGEDVKDGKTTVAGSVDDPEAEVTVSVNGEETKVSVGGDGKFELEVTLKEGEENSIKVTAKDESGNSQEIELKLSLKKIEYKIEVQGALEDGDDDGKKNDLKVTVSDQDGTVVAGATVKVGEAETTTNDSGEATFKDLAAGAHKIEATAEFDDEEITGSAEIEVEKVDFDLTASVIATLEDGDNDGKKNDLSVALSDMSDDVKAHLDAGNAVAIAMGDTSLGSYDGGDPVTKKDLEAGTYKVSAKIGDVTLGSAEFEIEKEKVDYKIEVTAMLSDGDSDGLKNDVVITVKDQDGTAVDGATVKIGDATLSTKSDGTCAMGNLDPGDYKVEASAEFDEEEVSGSAEFTVEKVEEKKEFSISITATLEDADGDGEKNDLKVGVQDQDGSAPPADLEIGGTFVKSSSDGEFAVSNLGEGTHKIKVTGYLMEDGTVADQKSAETEVEVAKAKVYSITIMANVKEADGDGRRNDVAVGVQDQDGSPVANAKVEADKTESGASVTETTNASGEATVKDLTAGDHTITVTATVGGKELSESASVNIEAKEYSMSLLCQVDGSTITCSVKDQDQEPVNGAAIVAQGTEVTTTGSDGTAKFQAKKPGDVKVRARAKFEGKNIWSEEVTVTIEEQDLSIRINLPRAMDADGVKNDVSGVVTTSGTGIQAEVTCGDESTNTNSGGEFVFNNLKPGTYKIIAEAEVKGIPAKAEDEVTIGSIKLDIMAMAQDLDGKGGRNDATVTLKYGTGSPVPGASVTIGQRNKSTNSEGACQFFNLPPGDHGVAAKISVAGQEIQATTSVSIEEYKLSIILQEPASLDGDNILNDLTVAVQDGMGQGVAGAQVKCGSKSGTTGSGGTVVLRGLDGGPQTISAELTIGSTTFKATESVEISKDVKIFEPVIPADLDGDNLENDVKVTVVNSRGQGISGARVRSDDDRSGVTGSDGSAVLTKLTIGNRSVSARVTIGSATATAPAVSFEVGDKIPPVVTMQPITQDPDTGMTFVLVNPAGQDLPEPKSYDVEISVIGAVDNQRADLLVDGTKAVTQSPISGGKLSAQIYFDIKPKDHLMEIQTEKLAPFKVAVKGSINDNRGPISYRLLLDGVVQEEKRNVAGNSITIERELTITKGVKNTIVLEAHDSNPQNKVRDSVEFVALGDKKYTEKFIVPMDKEGPQILTTLPLADSTIDEFTSPVPFQLGSETSAKIELYASLFDLSNNMVSPVTIRVTPPGSAYREYSPQLQGSEIKQWVDVVHGTNSIYISAKDKCENESNPEVFKIYVELGMGRITGRIKDSVTGKGIRGAKVTAVSKEGKGSFWGPTGSDGRYTIINVPYGEYFILVVRDNYLQGYVDNIKVPSRKSANSEIEPTNSLIDY